MSTIGKSDMNRPALDRRFVGIDRYTFLSGYIESWGRSVEKIAHECQQSGIQSPAYDSSMLGLMLTFHANPQHLIDALGPQDVRRISGDRLGEKLGEKLGETRTAIINAMLFNARITAVELARTLQISTTAVEKNLRILKEQGYIERIGPAKGGHWQVQVTSS